jgi:hypothetical protein
MRLCQSEKARKPSTKKLPPQATPEEIDRHDVTRLPSRSWRQHFGRGEAADDDHKRLAPTRVPGDARWAMDCFFLTRAEKLDKMKAVLNCLDMQSGATVAAVVHKGADDYALAVAHESLQFTVRSRIIVLSDQENAVKKLASMVRDSCASTGGIERCNYEVEKQIRSLKSRFEEVYKQPSTL